MRIAVENMPQRRALGVSLPLYWYNRPEQMARFPHVTLDTTHVGTWGWDLLDVYDTLRDRIAHLERGLAAHAGSPVSMVRTVMPRVDTRRPTS